MSLRAEFVRLGLRWFVKRKIGPAPLRWIPATSSLPRLLPQIELLRYGGASGSGGPFWQTQWAIPSWRADQGLDCEAAEIQRIAQNASRWPNVNTQNRVRAQA